MLSDAVRRLLSTLAFSGGIAAVVLLVGTHDMESYEHAFFSLDRGTAVQAAHVVGHPVYTLAIGLGVRLPLHGSLGASPAAVLAPYLPPPLTYWLLLTLAIAPAVLVVRHALDPLCGAFVSRIALVLLFWSAPLVNYTIYDDWPETALTYCAVVACVFAPHALIEVLRGPWPSSVRRFGALSVAAVVWGLVGASHPGFWPVLAVALVCTSIVAVFRAEPPLRTRLTVIAVLGAASLVVVALSMPDILREMNPTVTGAAADMKRYVDAVRGGLSANLFPFGAAGARLPFTFFVLAAVSLAIGVGSNDPRVRGPIVASALLSMVLAVAAASLSPEVSTFAPSAMWALRDPAIALAVFGGAYAAAAMRGSGGVIRFAGAGAAVAALLIGAVQGPAYAAYLVFPKLVNGDRSPWTHDMTPIERRASLRGLVRDRVAPGERMALWPGVRASMRTARHASTDLVDAGYPLVTAWTKQRTMRGLVEPNDLLFNQAIDLAPDVLCEPNAVRFLRVRYLLLPPDVDCPPWARVPGVLVDERLAVGVITARDDRVWALPVATAEQLRGRPALSAGSPLLTSVVPLSGTSLTIGGDRALVQLENASAATGLALVLPIAYDPAWRTSSGRTQNVGGLLAVAGVDRAQVTVDFVPDIVALLRALSMTVAQIATLVGLAGLTVARPA